MRWRPSVAGKLCAIFPSETFSVGMDVGLQVDATSTPGLPGPSSPGACCPPNPSGEEILELPSAPSPTQIKNMGSQGWRNPLPCKKRHENNNIRKEDSKGRLLISSLQLPCEGVSFLSTTEWEIEAQRGEPACPKTHSQEGTRRIGIQASLIEKRCR